MAGMALGFAHESYIALQFGRTAMRFLALKFVTMATRFKTNFKTAYHCRECGSTCYQPVIDRAPSGALVPNGQYRCAGCRAVFNNVQSWWAPRASLGCPPLSLQS
jgi:hypothetical protein